MRTLLILGLAGLIVSQGDPVVPVHQEPRHHLVFETKGTRVLDIQIPPGDTTLFHTHSDPILYVTMSTSRTRGQDHGGEWSAPAAAADTVTTGAPTVAPTTPPGRMMSTTSYADKPLTHRVNNQGPTLFRLIGTTNATAGDPSTEASGDFDGVPEITNRWFRGYRLPLASQPTADHRHRNPVLIVLVAGRASVRSAAAPNTQTLAEPGRFAFMEANVVHSLQGDGPGSEAVEVEIRRPR